MVLPKLTCGVKLEVGYILLARQPFQTLFLSQREPVKMAVDYLPRGIKANRNSFKGLYS